MSNYKIKRQQAHEHLSGDRVDWLDEFVENMHKNTGPQTAVDVARKRNQSILDQISNVVINQPRHATVDSVVKELRERTGLSEYLNRLAQEEQDKSVQKNAQSTQALEHIDPELRDKVIKFIDNKIKSHGGNINEYAIIGDLVKTFSQEGLKEEHINTEPVMSLISQMRADEMRLNTTPDNLDELGREDSTSDADDYAENNDFFSALMPDNQ